MKEEKSPLLQALQALTPVLNAAAQKELKALEELLATFQSPSISELKTELLKFKKTLQKERQKLGKTPEGFVARVVDFQNGVVPEIGEPDAVETLVADFGKASGPLVKAVAKKFELALVDKNDVDAFERWLKTGVKPPTVEERLQAEIEPDIQAALELRDQTRRELAPETIDQIILVAERVKTAYKTPGLELFMRGLDVVPTAKSAAAMIKELRRFLEEFALNRFKATQIRESGDY